MVRMALVVAAVGGLLGLLFLIAARGAARRRHWQRMITGGLLGLLLLTCSALVATAAVSIRGYRAFTREEVAATVRTYPLGPQRFRARFSTADGREEIFDVAGDAIYVDAHILKWRPWMNVLGWHTVYELDRVAGRYSSVADEKTKPRTVYALGRETPVDLFDVVRRFGALTFLIDAEYGSATFVGAKDAAAWEIRVSTSGLLARPLRPSAVPAAASGGVPASPAAP